MTLGMRLTRLVLKRSAPSLRMSVTANDGDMCWPSEDFQQHPSICDHGSWASLGRTWSGSPRNATSQFSLRSVEAGVAEACGPIATLIAPHSKAWNHC